MPILLRPQLRPMEVLPLGPKEELLFAMRDPEGFAATLAVPYGAAAAALLMDGHRSLAEIQATFKSQAGLEIPLSDLEAIVRRLDEAYLLAGDRFEQHRQKQVRAYLDNPVRPASHAGGAYAEEPEDLRSQLAGFFTSEQGPGALDPATAPDARQLYGVVSPHIDPHRGGPVYAWAYKHLFERSDADVFVIFGTAHRPMAQPFCVSGKDFETPLGIVPTERRLVEVLAEHLASSVAGRQIDLFEDEISHRMEHSIEFQVPFLQFVLGPKREFRIVPVLVGSFEQSVADGTPPGDLPEVQAFVAAMRAAAGAHSGNVCYIAGADLAHIGRQFGDEPLLDRKRLAEQSDDDRQLLEAACRCDPAGFFNHVARCGDRNRICGLSAVYTLLEVMGAAGGELLQYDQTVEPDGTGCVSFAAMAFYGE